MIKSEISSSYLSMMKSKHGSKPYPQTIKALVTGWRNEHSIGRAIYDRVKRLWGHCATFDGDVREWRLSDNENIASFNTLIMCHGVMHLDWLEDVAYFKMEEIIAVNLTGSISLMQKFVQATLDAPHRKKIISIGSMAYKSVLNGSAVYCASKAGLAHFMRCAAWELAPKGYDVFSIHPSNTADTPMEAQTISGLERYRHMTTEQAVAYWKDSSIRPMLMKDDICDLVEFLLRDRSGQLSGSDFHLAGGQR